MANSFSLYHELKTIGFQDDRIIVMNALDAYCDLRNPFVGDIYAENSLQTSVYNENMEIDYVGEDVNFQTIYELLSGRHYPHTPLSKRLQTDSNSNIFIFFTGHGGDQFFKFQDYEEISADDLYVLFAEMKLKRRYKNLLFLVDTCQASTLTEKITNLSGFISVSSSKKDENSYAYTTNQHLGITVIDRFTFSLLQFLRKYSFTQKEILKNSKTVEDLYSSFKRHFLHSTPILHVSSPDGERRHRLGEYFDLSREVREVETKVSGDYFELDRNISEISDLYDKILLEL
jgi:GPI-anchor transamidase subunit K